MHTKDSLLNGGSQGEPVEKAVEALPGPDALLLPEPLCAFQPKPKQRIDVRCLHSKMSVWQHNMELSTLMSDACTAQQRDVTVHSQWEGELGSTWHSSVQRCLTLLLLFAF